MSYYVVQNTVTNRCIVVDIKPTPDGVPALAYESLALADRALAEAAAYDVPDCSNPNDKLISYYVVQNPLTNRCVVVATKPTPDGVQALAYESRALANRALTEAAAYDVPDCSNPNDKVISAHVKVTENTSEATGGQTQARDYYLANPVVFGAVTPVISANLTVAALADGALEGPIALLTSARRAGVVSTLAKAPG